ncbi:MAG TPA: cellulase family glycosylhydrolase, partial [Acidimicrobiales bacterium]|nr:cellulase family glycosylhydrolase [Acidimicrobiales bacterium]
MHRVPLRSTAARFVLALGLAGLVSGTAVIVRPASAAPTVTVKVVGNHLVNGQGQPIRLIGVDRSGTEFACVQEWGIFDGPSDANSVAAMAAWHVNAVRVPLNEDCWLGINGVSSAYGGAAYRQAIENYVQELHAAGLVAIVDLHWNAPGATLATGQMDMADADHSVAFWSSVAATFRPDPGVVFDLYNEPRNISWSCWRNGCNDNGLQTAGMQQMLAAVRETGATQPVMAGGLNWAGDLSGWLANEPNDPLHQLVASVHVYNYSQCNTQSCWSSTIGPVAAAVPLVSGEIGETDCASAFITSYMRWADSVGVSYLGWTWNTWSCTAGPALISSYNGTSTTFGSGFQAHLAAMAAADPDFAPPPSTLSPGATTTTTTTPSTTTTTTIAAGAPPLPPSNASGLLDFSGGATHGWGVEWGNDATAGASASGLVLGLTGSGYPGFDGTQGLTSVAGGTTVTYAVDNPSGAAVQIVPFAQDSAWTVHFAPARTLGPGWNTVTWVVPAETGVNAIGLQINDPANWSGQLVLGWAAWNSSGQLDFSGSAMHGWGVEWGSDATVAGSSSGLLLGLTGS